MDRAFASGASGSAPSVPVSPSIGYPTAGNPGTGTPATKPGAYWYHMVTEEMRKVITDAGLTPDVSNLTQLSAAIQALIGNYTPAPGSVIYIAKSAAPTGYLKANGAAVSRTAYAALFAAIGTTFGAGDGSTTFNLPDLRGEFLRGLDDGRGVDSGRTIGSAQDGTWVRTVVQEWSGSDYETGTYNIGFAFAQADAEISTVGVGGTVPPGAKTPAGTAWYNPATTDNTMQGSAIISASWPINHWIKARPRNVALLACIRYQ